MRKNGYSNDRFDGAKSRYTLDQLKKAVPRACLRAAERLAKGTEVNKLVLCLAYREPDLTVNLNGIEAALAELSQNKTLSPSEKAEARAELLSERLKAQRVLGKSSTQSAPGDALGAANRSFFADLAKHRSLPLDSLSAAPDAPAGLSPETFGTLQTVPAGLTPEVHAGLSVPSGYNIQSLEAPVMATGAPGMAPPIIIPPDLNLSQEELAAVVSKQKTGSVEVSLRPLPNFRKLGIDRPAGPAVPNEMAAFSGHTRNDGSPVTVNDFYSVGGLITGNDLIVHLGVYFPVEELQRMEAMLKLRALKSDEDHSRKVASGRFTVVNPSVGTDPNTPLNRMHPDLGRVPYTALMGRLMFPLAENDEDQQAAVEQARRGRLQNLSPLFAYESISCANCGPIEVKPTITQNMVTGFTADKNHEIFNQQGDDWGCLSGTLRTPSDTTPGGFTFQSFSRLQPSAGGILQCEPLPESQLDYNAGSRLLVIMDRFSFFSSSYTWCRLHGMLGGRLRDGGVVVGAFTNVRDVLNLAAVDKPAYCDARAVPDPDIQM